MEQNNVATVVAPVQLGKPFMTIVERFLGQDGDKKVFVDTDGVRVFVPSAMRDSIEVGDFALVIQTAIPVVEKEADGSNKLGANGQPIPTGETTIRTELSFAGTLEEVEEKYYFKEALLLRAKEATARVAKGIGARRSTKPAAVAADNAEPVIGA